MNQRSATTVKGFTQMVAVIVFAASAVCLGAESPTRSVKQTVDEVSEAISHDTLPIAEQRELVFSIIEKRFDFQAMGRSALATNWKKASETQKSRFVALFQQILSHTYWNRIRTETTHTIEYVDEQTTQSNTARVKTRIVTAEKSIPVEYRLHLDGNLWLIHDVLIEGVSLIRTYRSDYLQVASQQGIDGLLWAMEAKIAATAE